MSEAETNDERTILDYLNEDCWSAVLHYVPLKHIMRSERVSKRWQMVILTYLRGARIRIKPSREFWKSLTQQESPPYWSDIDKNVKRDRLCKAKLTDTNSSEFETWVCKLGPSVISAYCDSEKILNILGNCPNLEAIMIYKLDNEVILRNHVENFKWLKKICFKRCAFLSDQSVKRIMTNSTIETLEIYCGNVTGQFLINKKPVYLKSLILEHCCIQLSPLLSASDSLSGLRRLQLGGERDTYEDLHLVLDKLPNLEHVTILGAEMVGDKFFEAISRLSRLGHLCTDFNATNADVKAVARNCMELRCLNLMSCDYVWECGLAAICAHAGSRLTALAVVRSYLANDPVVACVRACPRLETLNLSECRGLTREILPLVAAARREMQSQYPLVINIRGCFYPIWKVVTPKERIHEEFDELIIRQ